MDVPVWKCAIMWIPLSQHQRSCLGYSMVLQKDGSLNLILKMSTLLYDGESNMIFVLNTLMPLYKGAWFGGIKLKNIIKLRSTSTIIIIWRKKLRFCEGWWTKGNTPNEAASAAVQKQIWNWAFFLRHATMHGVASLKHGDRMLDKVLEAFEIGSANVLIMCDKDNYKRFCAMKCMHTFASGHWFSQLSGPLY